MGGAYRWGLWLRPVGVVCSCDRSLWVGPLVVSKACGWGLPVGPVERLGSIPAAGFILVGLFTFRAVQTTRSQLTKRAQRGPRES